MFKKQTCSICQQPIKEDFPLRPGASPRPKGNCAYCWDLTIGFDRLAQVNPKQAELWLKKKASERRIKTFQDECGDDS